MKLPHLLIAPLVAAASMLPGFSSPASAQSGGQLDVETEMPGVFQGANPSPSNDSDDTEVNVVSRPSTCEGDDCDEPYFSEILPCSQGWSGAGLDGDCRFLVTSGTAPSNCVDVGSFSGLGGYYTDAPMGENSVYYCPVTETVEEVTRLGLWGPEGSLQAGLCVKEWVVIFNGERTNEQPLSCAGTFRETRDLPCDGQEYTLAVGYTVKLDGDFDRTWFDGDLRPAIDEPDGDVIYGLNIARGTASCGVEFAGDPAPTQLSVTAPKSWAADGSAALGRINVSTAGNNASTSRTFLSFNNVGVSNYPENEWDIQTSGRDMALRFFYPSDASGSSDRSYFDVRGSARVQVDWTRFYEKTYTAPKECLPVYTDVWKVVTRYDLPMVWNVQGATLNGVGPITHTYTTYEVVTERVWKYNPETGAIELVTVTTREPVTVRETVYPQNTARWNQLTDAPAKVYREEFANTQFRRFGSCDLANTATSRDDVAMRRIDNPSFSFAVDVVDPSLSR